MNKIKDSIGFFILDGLAIGIPVVLSYALLYILSVLFGFVIEQPFTVLVGQTFTSIFMIWIWNYIWHLAVQTNVLNEEIEKAKTLIKTAEKRDEDLKDDTKSDKDNDDWAA